jgi:dynactin-4
MMSFSFPYSYFSCPCTKRGAIEDGGVGRAPNAEEPEEDEKPFDPRSPRANYSLYPLDHLLWCEDCHEIRCPRCTVEEVVCWYCPSCLFEVASGMVKSEGNR